MQWWQNKRGKVLVVEDHDGLRAAIAAISRPEF